MLGLSEVALARQAAAMQPLSACCEVLSTGHGQNKQALCVERIGRICVCLTCTRDALLLQGRVAGMDSELYDHAASHLGKAVGMCNLLRGTAYHAAR